MSSIQNFITYDVNFRIPNGHVVYNGCEDVQVTPPRSGQGCQSYYHCLDFIYTCHIQLEMELYVPSYQLYFTVANRMDHDFRGRYLIHYTRGSRNEDHHFMYSNKSMIQSFSDDMCIFVCKEFAISNNVCFVLNIQFRCFKNQSEMYLKLL